MGQFYFAVEHSQNLGFGLLNSFSKCLDAIENPSNRFITICTATQSDINKNPVSIAAVFACNANVNTITFNIFFHAKRFEGTKYIGRLCNGTKQINLLPLGYYQFLIISMCAYFFSFSFAFLNPSLASNLSLRICCCSKPNVFAFVCIISRITSMQ